MKGLSMDAMEWAFRMGLITTMVCVPSALFAGAMELIGWLLKRKDKRDELED